MKSKYRKVRGEDFSIGWLSTSVSMVFLSLKKDFFITPFTNLNLRMRSFFVTAIVGIEKEIILSCFTDKEMKEFGIKEFTEVNFFGAYQESESSVIQLKATGLLTSMTDLDYIKYNDSLKGRFLKGDGHFGSIQDWAIGWHKEDIKRMAKEILKEASPMKNLFKFVPKDYFMADYKIKNLP